MKSALFILGLIGLAVGLYVVNTELEDRDIQLAEKRSENLVEQRAFFGNLKLGQNIKETAAACKNVDYSWKSISRSSYGTQVFSCIPKEENEGAQPAEITIDFNSNEESEEIRFVFHNRKIYKQFLRILKPVGDSESKLSSDGLIATYITDDWVLRTYINENLGFGFYMVTILPAERD